MDVAKLWVIALKTGLPDYEAGRPGDLLDSLETVRVNGAIGLPVFTSRANAERYVQNEKCLQVEVVQPADSVVGMAGFLKGKVEWKELVYLVIDPAEARTTSSTTLASKVLQDIIAELDKYAPKQ
jgi:hypothetical protein